MSNLKAVYSSASVHWCTPPAALEPVYALDPVGLDPCSNRWSTVRAAESYDLERGQDGLELSWGGRGLVFCNPPYSRKDNMPWAKKAVWEAGSGTEIVILVPARVDTAWFHLHFAHAQAMCFRKGRIKFINPADPEADSPNFPPVYIYYGTRAWLFCDCFRGVGACLPLDYR